MITINQLESFLCGYQRVIGDVATVPDWRLSSSPTLSPICYTLWACYESKRMPIDTAYLFSRPYHILQNISSNCWYNNQ
ncbi:hypothetical protein M0802_001616 [Mischocyttarus mexicanus]|nr:hypothetical protein M0802_001616 [Mischocyttarus mexicanus]